MDLIRKMSGLRSSQEMKHVKDLWGEESDREEVEVVDDNDVEGGDVFEDAAHGEQEQLVNGFGEESTDVPPIRVRASVYDENGHEEEVAVDEEKGAGDGHASTGSGESFDSALERMAASSTASYDPTSPKSLSSVESFRYAEVDGDTIHEFEPSQGADEELNDSQIPSPRDDTVSREYVNGESHEKNFDNGVADNGEESHVAASDDGNIEAEAPMLSSEFVQQSNGGEKDRLIEETGAGNAVAEELLSTESEGISSENLKEACSAENEDEEFLTSPVIPIAKVAAMDVLGNDGLEEHLDGQVEVNGEEFLDRIVRENNSQRFMSEENSDQKEDEIFPKVSAPASEEAALVVVSLGEGNTEHIDEANKYSEETRALPIAKLSVNESELNGFDNRGADAEGGDTVSVEKPADAQGVQSLTADVGAVQDNSVEKNSELASGTPEDQFLSTKSIGMVSENGSVKSLNTAPDGELLEKQPTDATQLEHAFKIKIPSQPKVEDEVEEFLVHDLGEGEEADEERDWDEEIEEDDEEDSDSLVERSAALAALVGAADSAGGTSSLGATDSTGETPTLGAAGPSLPARPTRIVRVPPTGGSGARSVQQSRSVPDPSSNSAGNSQTNGEVADGNEETREKLQAIRIKFLRLALRLGQSAHNVVVAQVLYRLGLAEQLRGSGRSTSRGGPFSFDRASAIAEEQEASGPEELDFTCTIMLLGKTGVGKSATINSIFDEPMTVTNAFSPSTNKVQIITGNVHGIKVRVIDTPGLLPSLADQRHNEKVMASVKRFITKHSPDIVLYFDRLDMQSRDYGDLPLLRTITDTFGAAVWFNAIVVLTHASSAPPDGPNGLPLSYEMFVAQRSHVVQQTIRQAAGDMRLMNPVSLVENHSACRVNRAGQRVLPNGQVWKPQLLLLCFASKVLAEANSLLKLQDNTPGKPFGVRQRVPPLPFLLSSLLQSRAQLKLPDEQVGEEDESDEDLDEDDESDEDEDYDQLPPFRRLAKEEIAELDEDNRKKYFEELVERERLFQKKQWKEEKKRRRDLKRRMAEARTDQSQLGDEGVDDDMSRSAAVPVPMPDMVLPPSFDSDNPSYRYRYLESASQWLVRPVLEAHGWDHDSGYDGMSVEKLFVIADKIPASVSGQITKDKKEASVNMECAASLKHGEEKVTLAGVDIQTVGKDMAYTLRSETRFSNFKGNKTTGGLAITLLGDTMAAGMKIENRLIAGKRFKLVLNGGAMTGRDEIAYGGSLEATLRDKDYPLGRTLSTLGISVMDWHGDLAVGGNLQSQHLVGETMMVARANLNNRGAGQISIRASSSEQLQMALIGLLPIFRSLVNRLFGSQSQQ